MFTLRKISGNGIEMNAIIGDRYTMIYRDHNPEEFREEFKVLFGKDHVADLDTKSDSDTKECYAIVCNPPFYKALYKNQKNFIMTDSGKTFANISYK